MRASTKGMITNRPKTIEKLNDKVKKPLADRGGSRVMKKSGKKSKKGKDLETLRKEVIEYSERSGKSPTWVLKEALGVAYGDIDISAALKPHGPLDSFREMSEDLEDYLMLEWAILYAEMTPGPYLREVKGFSQMQSESILAGKPAKLWFEKRSELQNKITETLVVRHIDLVAEVQDRHVKASNLAMAKATQLLLKGNPIVDKEGNPVLNREGVQGFTPLKSSDILNITAALKNVQDTYRKAMGFKDDQGITQIVEKMQMVQVNNTAIQNETNTEVVEQRKNALDELSHEEIKALVSRARELAKRG